MENAEEILQCLDEFSKVKPKDIPRELEEYLCFVAKTGDPVYQWPVIKCLVREKLLNVITDFYETCPSIEIPPCPNVDTFNYDIMKNFILEKLDTFAAAPFTVQRICELLTAPRKEYNRIDKYMRALEKNILVVSTREPGRRTENGESVVNGLESEHVPQEIMSSEVNVEVEMDEGSVWAKEGSQAGFAMVEPRLVMGNDPHRPEPPQETYVPETKTEPTCSSTIETVITARPTGYIGYTPNITDLIVEPSVTESTPTATETAPPEQQGENSSLNVFAVADAAAEEAKEEQVEPVFVKTECSETAYTSVIQLEPVPSVVYSESASDDNDEVPEEPSVEEDDTEDKTKKMPSSTVVWEPVSNSTESTISSSDEMVPINSESSTIPETAQETTENQVTDSNVESEYVLSQTQDNNDETATLESSTSRSASGSSESLESIADLAPSETDMEIDQMNAEVVDVATN